LTVLTEIEHQGENVLVAVHFKPTGEVSDIRSIYPKSSQSILNWIGNGLATYYHKEKALSWLHRMRGSNSPRAWNQLQATPNVKTDDDVVKPSPTTAPLPAAEEVPGEQAASRVIHEAQIAGDRGNLEALTALQARYPRLRNEIESAYGSPQTGSRDRSVADRTTGSRAAS
jgi:hypothetical protein